MRLPLLPVLLSRGLRTALAARLLLVGSLMLLLVACGSSAREGPCLEGRPHCAASETPPGLREVRRGYRIGRYHWLPRINRESGVPDVGIQAEWLPIQERR